LQAFRQGDAGNFFNSFHQADQRALVLRADGRKADAAVAEQDGGDAMPRRRGELAVPRRLAVVVGMHIDPAGGDDLAFGIDVAVCRTGFAADFGYPVAVDGDITSEGLLAGAINDGAAADDGVVHGRSLLGSSWRRAETRRAGRSRESRALMRPARVTMFASD